ncbi:MAG: HPF/RaiA family ribosome-associated protein [Burkholderiales bacterium]|nr:HPF/RaiA family ribosome-associated protein [Burkholderiales bacterium]
MQLPLQVTFRGIRQSEPLEAAIHASAAKLEATRANITSCRVVVEERSRHQSNGREFSVRVDLRVPGREIVVNRAHDEDAYAAVREAFDDARRQLEELLRIQRGEVKSRGA